MLRSCYTTNMRFYPDRPDVLTAVRWYFTDPAAPWCGRENVFNSRVWYDGTEGEPPLLGEDLDSPRRWVNGQAPAGLRSAVCESNPAVWTEGVPFDQAGSVPYDAQGNLLCCLADAPDNELTFNSVCDFTTP